jgi:hypothetical protein
VSLALGAVLAHGIGSVQDLPVPAWLFYYGAALVLVASFIALGVLWTKPRLENARERPLPTAAQRVVLSPALRFVVGTLSFALLVLVLAAGLGGEDSQYLNLAPIFVYVVFWLGLPLLSVLLGDVWRVLNPWRAAADACAFLARRGRFSWQPPLHYPQWLGFWPAAALLFCFVALELAYPDRTSPRNVAIAACVYSWITWTMAAAFGRRAWFENGEAFSAYFGLLSRLAPLGVRHREGARELVLRPPLTGLTKRDPRPGTIALVAVVLGSVAFDGLSRTNLWEDLIHQRREALTFAVNVAGLAAAVAFVAATYLAAVTAARAATRRQGLAAEFLSSLVPIALAYLVAHYFSLFVREGQYAIQLASDPFGFGWDLLGTKDFRPNLTIISPRATWYVQVGALVVGHVLGLMLAHDRAVGLFASLRTALRAQYAMLTLMVLYTVGGMWILSRP